VCEELFCFNCSFKWTGSKGKIVRGVVKLGPIQGKKEKECIKKDEKE